jgi:hypothetical protein
VDTRKINKWIKIIALWQLICAVVNVFLLILPHLLTIQANITLHDWIEASVNAVGGLVIFFGLWRFTPWSWKVAVLFIPLSWAYVTCDLLIDYHYGVGLVISPFIFIDFLILSFLFRRQVAEIFKILSTNWIKLSWLVSPLFIVAVFLLIHDMLNDIIAIVLAATILFGFHTANKYKRKVQSRNI